jgi:probable blue pigment (indigoidine) exporter
MSKISLIINLLITSLAPLVWGSTYIITTQVLPPDMPLLASTLRALPAGIILLLIYRKIPQGNWWIKLAILGMLNIGIFFYCLFSAAYYLPGGTAAVIMSSQPLILIGLSAVFFNARIKPLQIMAALLGMLGIGLLALQGNVILNWQGVAFGLTGAASMALGLILTKKWGKPADFSLIDFTGWQLTFGGLMLLPMALLAEDLPSSLTVSHIAGFSYLCLVGSVFGYMIWFRGIERLPVLTSSFLGFLSPISAGVLGYLILDEQLTPMQWLGVIAIIMAIVLTQILNAKLPNKQASTKAGLNDIQAKTIASA